MSSCPTPGQSEEDGMLGPFALEIMLARQELASSLNASASSSTSVLEDSIGSITLQSSSLPLQDATMTMLTQEEEYDDRADGDQLEEQIWETNETELETLTEDEEAALCQESDSLLPANLEMPLPLPSSEPSQNFVSPVEDDYPGLWSRIRNRQEILSPRLRLSVMGGWRGWRTGSQPCTPVAEEPPKLETATTSIQSPLPKPYEQDYFGTATTTAQKDILDQISSTLTSSLNSAVSDSTQCVEVIPLRLPRLSPDFTFGRHVLVPPIEEATDNYTDIPPLQHSRRLRAASADQVNLPHHHQQTSPFKPSLAQAQAQRSLHKHKLSLRMNGSVPRVQGQSFDAVALKKFRESAGGVPKYAWI